MINTKQQMNTEWRILETKLDWPAPFPGGKPLPGTYPSASKYPWTYPLLFNPHYLLSMCQGALEAFYSFSSHVICLTALLKVLLENKEEALCFPLNWKTVMWSEKQQLRELEG